MVEPRMQMTQKNNPTVGDSVKLKHPYAYLVPFDGIRPLSNVAHGGL